MNASRDLVLSKVRETFPHRNAEDVLAILDLYGTESHETERERVQFAILKLSGGNEDSLLEYVNTAKRDLRDVIFPAEYPGFWEIGFVGVAKLDAESRRRLKERDLHQYLSWLQNTDEPDTTGYEDWLQGG